MIQLVASALAIVFSGISPVVSIRAYRLSARHQRFEFAPRLDIAHENVQMATRSFPVAFRYEAELVNQGLKPVDVSRVTMDCGSKDDPQRREHHVLLG
jgi:hypothetical protein